MKALSLLQPWATLVVMGRKTIETRNWATKHRGDILIHASKGKAGSIFANDPPFKKYIKNFENLPFGAIIGRATIIDVLEFGRRMVTEELMNRLTMEEKAFGDYTEGRYGWLLDDCIEFEKPIPASGLLNLWEYPYIS